ncbi:hypothetical protein [Yinghuangia seranimata]|uniref:hypothetical protein n=1 Tax=Yinghuangia seranimata TaxID=408067 RepID=UPI00248B6CC4|nr:hypothetical protein [Yinghuangia seranimata]MDI2127454.1 hypothetical protein [Yinghuangia seranimata]
MRSARMRLAGAAVVPLLLLGTACKFGSDDKSDKKDSTAQNAGASAPAQAPASSAPAPAASPSDTAKAPAGKALDAAKLKTTLLTAKDLPAGWSVAPAANGGTQPAKITPPVCQPIYDLLSGDGKRNPVAQATETMKGPGDTGVYTVQLAEFAPGTAQELLDKAAAVADNSTSTPCLDFSAKDAKGVVTLFELNVTTDKVGKLGDGTLSLLLTYGDEKSMKNPSEANPSGILTIVRSGNALVGISGVGDPTTGNFPKDLPNTILKTQVDKVATARKG